MISTSLYPFPRVKFLSPTDLTDFNLIVYLPVAIVAPRNLVDFYL